MAKRFKTWALGPAKLPTANVPGAMKADLSSKAQEIIDHHLKPTHIKRPPNKADFNYLTELYTKCTAPTSTSAPHTLPQVPMPCLLRSRSALPEWVIWAERDSVSRICGTLGSGGRFTHHCPWMNALQRFGTSLTSCLSTAQTWRGTPFPLKRTPSQKEDVHINPFMFQQHTLTGTPGQLVSGIRGYRIKRITPFVSFVVWPPSCLTQSSQRRTASII